jgi:hypothetical protein
MNSPYLSWAASKPRPRHCAPERAAPIHFVPIGRLAPARRTGQKQGNTGH